MPDETQMSAFEKLLFAMQDASRESEPHKHGYAEKRTAVLDHEVDLQNSKADLRSRMHTAQDNITTHIKTIHRLREDIEHLRVERYTAWKELRAIRKAIDADSEESTLDEVRARMSKLADAEKMADESTINLGAFVRYLTPLLGDDFDWIADPGAAIKEWKSRMTEVENERDVLISEAEQTIDTLVDDHGQMDFRQAKDCPNVVGALGAIAMSLVMEMKEAERDYETALSEIAGKAAEERKAADHHAEVNRSLRDQMEDHEALIIHQARRLAIHEGASGLPTKMAEGMEEEAELREVLAVAEDDAAEEKERRIKSGERAQHYANELRQARGKFHRAEKARDELRRILHGAKVHIDPHGGWVSLQLEKMMDWQSASPELVEDRRQALQDRIDVALHVQPSKEDKPITPDESERRRQETS